jgi:hypothetical protein
MIKPPDNPMKKKLQTQGYEIKAEKSPQQHLKGYTTMIVVTTLRVTHNASDHHLHHKWH